MDEILKLYNDGHNPFPHLGKGGLGYHLPRHHLIGKALIRTINGDRDILDEYDDGNTDDPNIYYIPGTTEFDIDNPDDPGIHNKGHVIYDPETGDIENIEDDYEYLPPTTTMRAERETEHEIELFEANEILDTLLNSNRNISGEEFERLMCTTLSPIIQHDLDDYSDIINANDNPNYLNLKYSNGNSMIVMIDGVQKPISSVAVFDAEDEKNAIEIKYKKNEDHTNGFNLQNTKIEGNSSFVPLYYKVKNKWKLYDVFCAGNNTFVTPSQERNDKDAWLYALSSRSLIKYCFNHDISDNKGKDGKNLIPVIYEKKVYRPDPQPDWANHIGTFYEELKTPTGKKLYRLIVRDDANGEKVYKESVDWVGKPTNIIKRNKLKTVRRKKVPNVIII